MKVFALIPLVLAVATQARVIPLCPATCMTNAIIETGCSPTDTECICAAESFLSSVTSCAESDCGDAIKATELAGNFCGVTEELKKRTLGLLFHKPEPKLPFLPTKSEPKLPFLPTKPLHGLPILPLLPKPTLPKLPITPTIPYLPIPTVF